MPPPSAPARIPGPAQPPIPAAVTGSPPRLKLREALWWWSGVAEIAGEGAVVEAAGESMIGKVSDTRLIWTADYSRGRPEDEA